MRPKGAVLTCDCNVQPSLFDVCWYSTSIIYGVLVYKGAKERSHTDRTRHVSLELLHFPFRRTFPYTALQSPRYSLHTSVANDKRFGSVSLALETKTGVRIEWGASSTTIPSTCGTSFRGPSIDNS
jgi:hypothetical protein